jgi:hypothetical protein
MLVVVVIVVVVVVVLGRLQSSVVEAHYAVWQLGCRHLEPIVNRWTACDICLNDRLETFT